MEQLRRSAKIAAPIWSVLIGIGIVVLGVSILLPSTKRARIDFEHLRQEQAEQAANASTEPATTEPTTTSPTAAFLPPHWAPPTTAPSSP